MNNVIQSTSTCLVLLMLAPALVRADDDTSQQTDKQTTPLSVAPLDHIDYPIDRPHWLEDSPNLDDDTHSWVVVAGPSDTPEEAAELLKVLQRAAVASYIDRLSNAGGRLDFYPINDRWIEKELITNRYSGKLTQGDTTLHEQAVQLEFSPHTQERILAAWKNVEVRDRLGALGVLMFGGIVCLVISSTVIGAVSRRVERRDAMRSPASSV